MRSMVEGGATDSGRPMLSHYLIHHLARTSTDCPPAKHSARCSPLHRLTAVPLPRKRERMARVATPCPLPRPSP